MQKQNEKTAMRPKALVEPDHARRRVTPGRGWQGGQSLPDHSRGLPVPGGFCATTKAYAEPAESASIAFDRFRCVGTEELKSPAARPWESFQATLIYSHGAVAAREYGIPAVVRLSGATHRIVTGQRITGDGAGGAITLVA